MTAITRSPNAPSVRRMRFVWKDHDGYLDGKMIVNIRPHEPSGGVIWMFRETKTRGFTQSFDGAKRVVEGMVKRGVVR